MAVKPVRPSTSGRVNLLDDLLAAPRLKSERSALQLFSKEAPCWSIMLVRLFRRCQWQMGLDKLDRERRQDIRNGKERRMKEQRTLHTQSRCRVAHDSRKGTNPPETNRKGRASIPEKPGSRS